MLKFVILLSVVTCAFGAALPGGLLPLLDGRIVNGQLAGPGFFPWQVSLQRNGFHFCGGSIYSINIIVTAAHCLQNVAARFIKVRAGSIYLDKGGYVYNVSSFKNHEYNPRTQENDIAVIRLSSKLKLGSNIRPIQLATTRPRDGLETIVSGWGVEKHGSTNTPNQLRFTIVRILSNNECSGRDIGYGDRIKSTMMCAFDPESGVCQGDSGGPLVSIVDGVVLVGVVSWGIGCASLFHPGVYTDVSAFQHWVLLSAFELEVNAHSPPAL